MSLTREALLVEALKEGGSLAQALDAARAASAKTAGRQKMTMLKSRLTLLTTNATLAARVSKAHLAKAVPAATQAHFLFIVQGLHANVQGASLKAWGHDLCRDFELDATGAPQNRAVAFRINDTAKDISR